MKRIDRSRMDRRALFASGVAAALLAATGVSAQNSPRRGGELRIAVPRAGGLMEQVARGAIFDNLTEVGPDGLLRGELATEWHSDETGANWRFDLRRDVTFHDSTPLTAEHVVQTLTAQGIPAKIAGDAQFAVSLVVPNPHLPYLLAARELMISASGDLSLAQANGTGCYQVERAQDGRHFRATRVSSHYKDGTAGWVDQLELIVIPDAQVRAEALRDGYVDVAALPSPAELRQSNRFQFFPSEDRMDLAAQNDVGLPRNIGTRTALDDGRIGERWWRL